MRSLVFCLLAWFTLPLAAQSTFTVLSSTGGDHPPYVWFDQSKGQENGFIFRIQDEVFKDLNIPVRREFLNFRSEQDWQQATAAVIAGRIDLITGATERSAMDGRLVFIPEPVIELKYHLLTLANNKKIEPRAALDNLHLIMVGRNSGTYFHLLFPAAKLAVFHTQDEAFKALLSGRYDGMLASYYAALAFTRLYDSDKAITISETVYANFPVYMAISKTSPLLPRLAEINSKLVEMKEQGRYKLILYQTMQHYLRQVSGDNKGENKQENNKKAR